MAFFFLWLTKLCSFIVSWEEVIGPRPDSVRSSKVADKTTEKCDVWKIFFVFVDLNIDWFLSTTFLDEPILLGGGTRPRQRVERLHHGLLYDVQRKRKRTGDHIWEVCWLVTSPRPKIRKFSKQSLFAILMPIEQRILDINAGRQQSWAATDVYLALVFKNELHINIE